MDNDALHFRTELEKFEESVWDAEKHFKFYQIYRDDIRNAWDDNASREVNRRYLNPNSEDSKDFISELSNQKTFLVTVSEEVSQISQLFEEANYLSRQIEQLRHQIEEDMSLAAMNYENSRDHFSAAENSLTNATSLIQQANSMS